METILGWQAWFTLLVVVGILVALVREWARPDLIFITALGILLLTGILSPEEAFSGFSNEAVFTVGALFVVAAGVQNTRALGFLERIILPDKASLTGALARLMSSTAFMSAFLNNTPIVAMLIPQVQQWADRTGHAVSKLLIPLSYAAITGGIVTLIGTSTNLIVSGMLVQRGYEPLGFFELTWIGLPAALIVFIYFVTIGHRTLPDRQPGRRRSESGASYQFDLEIPDVSPLIGKKVEESGLWSLDNAFLMHIHRDGVTISPIPPGERFRSGDVLTFVGDIRQVDELALRNGLKRSVPLLAHDEDGEDLPLFDAVVSASSPLVGRTLRESAFLDRYRGVVVGIQRRDESFHGAIGSIPLRPGDLLLIEAHPGFDDQWNGAKDEFYLVTARGRRNLPAGSKAPVALFILLLVIGLAATGVLPISVTAFAGAILTVISGCLPYREIFGALNLPILLVIAAAIGVGGSLETSGLAFAGAGLILDLTSAFGFLAVLAAIYLITNLLTELITNNAAAVLMVPLAVATAAELGMNPHAAAVTVAVAASASFLTPIGYQTNLMVLGAGEYRFSDYFRAGLPVTLILMSLTVFLVHLKWI